MEFQISLNELPAFARKFWELAGNRKVIAFHGQMGAGKTTLIAALCQEQNVKDVTGSPTFSIINEYETLSGESIFHIDLYRLKDEEEVIAAGVQDCVDSGSICLVEWPEKAPDLFDEETLHIYLEVVDETKRRIRIEG